MSILVLETGSLGTRVEQLLRDHMLGDAEAFHAWDTVATVTSSEFWRQRLEVSPRYDVQPELNAPNNQFLAQVWLSLHVELATCDQLGHNTWRADLAWYVALDGDTREIVRAGFVEFTLLDQGADDEANAPVDRDPQEQAAVENEAAFPTVTGDRQADQEALYGPAPPVIAQPPTDPAAETSKQASENARAPIRATQLESELAAVVLLAETQGGRSLSADELAELRSLVEQRVAELERLEQLAEDLRQWKEIRQEAERQAFMARQRGRGLDFATPESLKPIGFWGEAWVQVKRLREVPGVIRDGFVDYTNEMGDRTREYQQDAMDRGDYRGASFANWYAAGEMAVEGVDHGLSTFVESIAEARRAEDGIEIAMHSIIAALGLGEAVLNAYGLAEPLGALTRGGGGPVVGGLSGSSGTVIVTAPAALSQAAIVSAVVGHGGAAAIHMHESGAPDSSASGGTDRPSKKTPSTPEEAAELKRGGARWTNDEVRDYYNDTARSIKAQNEEWKAAGMSAEDRARRTYAIRKNARLTGRAMMSDEAEVAALRKRDSSPEHHGGAGKVRPDGPTFDDLVEKARAKGFAGDDIYEEIIRTASTTDEATNATYGRTKTTKDPG